MTTSYLFAIIQNIKEIQVNKITQLIKELRKYTTEKGNQLLDQLIDEILKELDKMRIKMEDK